MKCFECGWARVSRTREGGLRCPRCGTAVDAKREQQASAEQPSTVVKVYTLAFAIFGLAFPFFVPIIVKLSQKYPMELGLPW